MLQRTAVLPGTLSLLKNLIGISDLKDYYLVGGTALALQFGHRLSVDLDFFTDDEFEPDKIGDALPEGYLEFGRSKVFYGAHVEGIKCDFVRNLFPLQLPLIVDEGVRMAQPLEIAAMKFWAITRRGAKKDFWDLYFLLQRFTLEEIFALFAQKYPAIDPMMVSRSLAYFNDADAETDPVAILRVSWLEVKQSIRAKLRAYENQV
jgi:predicted nucleotidyltransferase component of viral defense system